MIHVKIQNVVIAGGGVLGSQIAFQAAYCGFNVTLWLRSEGSITRTQPKLDHLKQVYSDTIRLMATDEGKTPLHWARGIADYQDFNEQECLQRVETAYQNIKIEIDMGKAVHDADLVIESMAENLEDKIAFYKQLAAVLPSSSLIVTNSSTFLPSKLAKFTGRPDKYLSLHFANSIWKNNTAEIMPHGGTAPENFDKIMEFAKEIRMIPLPVRKEKAGYLLNSMLIPLLFSGMDLYVNGISDPESIDKAWTLGTGSPKGPFQILDTVGLVTAYNIVQNYVKVPSFLAPYNFKGMSKMLKKYIDEGKLGVSSGEGFYRYEP
ncbi:3-hydroxybutyryl-CoA dehydrogenase [Clostridiaceae bacterium JG1575]|nr:3-hydroxybutyryl-CoA dehydrogenase [Clostridiaceae bacterium JG1575]